MNILYNIRQKSRIIILVIMVFFLVIFSSNAYNKNIDEMDDISSEMYADRLLAQDYIYKIGKILHEKKFNLKNQSDKNIHEISKKDSIHVVLILAEYEKTKLTKEEKVLFLEFKSSILYTMLLEHRYELSNNEYLKADLLALQMQSINNSLAHLDKLGDIQTKTGKQLNEASKQIVTFSTLLNQFDWAVLIIIGLVIQVIIFTTRSSIPKDAQNKFLN